MVAANHATHLLPRFCLKRDMYQTGEVEVEVRWRWKHDNPHNSLHTLKFIIRVPTNTYITEALIPTRFRAIHSFKFQIVPRPEEGRNHPYLAKRISGGRQPNSLFFCSLKKSLLPLTVGLCCLFGVPNQFYLNPSIFDWSIFILQLLSGLLFKGQKKFTTRTFLDDVRALPPGTARPMNLTNMGFGEAHPSITPL
jgi:hypothetical protein